MAKYVHCDFPAFALAEFDEANVEFDCVNALPLPPLEFVTKPPLAPICAAIAELVLGPTAPNPVVADEPEVTIPCCDWNCWTAD